MKAAKTEGIVRTNDRVIILKIQTRVSCLGKARKCGTVLECFRWENSCGPSDIYLCGEGCQEGSVRTNDKVSMSKIQTRVSCLGKAPKCGTVLDFFRWENSCGPSDIYICGEGCKEGIVRTNDKVSMSKIQTRVSCLGNDIYIRGEGWKEGIVRTNDKVIILKIQTCVSPLGKAPKCGTVFECFTCDNSCGLSDIYIRGEGCKEGIVRTNDNVLNVLTIQAGVSRLGKAPKCGTVFEFFRLEKQRQFHQPGAMLWDN